MDYADILHRCFRCGYCKLPSSYQDINCPSYLAYRFESFAPGGRMWLLRAWLNEEIATSQRLSEILFSCAACGNCTEHCVFPKFKSDLLNAFTSGRSELVNEGIIPATVRDYFKSIHLYGNPYNLPESDRDTWAEGLGLDAYENQEYLLYIGCPGSFDERGQRMARAVATLLRDMGVSFGIMGRHEWCDGNEVRTLGEFGLYELTAKKNIDLFADAGVKKVITLSPHAYHTMKNEYPALGADFQVVHYTQLLAQISDSLPTGEKKRSLSVTFHDPCYLGRHNKDFYSPRTVLERLDGVQVVEMDRSMNDSLCCGGGGGNFFTDILPSGDPGSPSRTRIREAAETGADVLAVACPKCAKMFEDAVKAEGLEDRLWVCDIAELIIET